MYFNETVHSYSLPGPRDTDDTSMSWVQRSSSQTTFSKKVHLSSSGMISMTVHRQRHPA